MPIKKVVSKKSTAVKTPVKKVAPRESTQDDVGLPLSTVIRRRIKEQNARFHAMTIFLHLLSPEN